MVSLKSGKLWSRLELLFYFWIWTTSSKGIAKSNAKHIVTPWRIGTMKLELKSGQTDPAGPSWLNWATQGQMGSDLFNASIFLWEENIMFCNPGTQAKIAWAMWILLIPRFWSYSTKSSVTFLVLVRRIFKLQQRASITPNACLSVSRKKFKIQLAGEVFSYNTNIYHRWGVS